jgi:predicted DCC family thiol-disulfide oxidoreductase YuxK
MESLTIYYDGQCPLCQAEIRLLRARNRQGLLRFVDLCAPVFDETSHRISCVVALEIIHGRLDNGELLTGLPVFAEAYRRADMPVLAWLLSRPWLTPLLNRGYRRFVQYRHTISRAIGPSLLRLAQRIYP